MSLPHSPSSLLLGSVSQLGTRCLDVITEVLWYYVTIVMLMEDKKLQMEWGEGLGVSGKWNLILLRAGEE